MTALTVLRFCIDTLVFTFRGKLSEGVPERLEKAKAQAVGADGPIPFLIGDDEMFVLPKGRGKYRYVLEREGISISITESKCLPTASVSLGAKCLLERGPEALYSRAHGLCRELGAGIPNTLSRIDVAVDFQGFEPTHDDLLGVVCAATKRREVFGGERLQTASWGKSPIMLRIYDKTQQVREMHKECWNEAWALSPAYDPAERVYRCEAEIRRAVLKELGVYSVADALSCPGRLLDFAMRWCELRVPTLDGTKARWAVDPRWVQLREAVYSGEPVSRVRLKAALMDDETLRRRMIGLVATHAARHGLESWQDALESLAIDAEVYLDSGALDFAEQTEKRRRRLLTA
jgi:hypothetical protein